MDNDPHHQLLAVNQGVDFAAFHAPPHASEIRLQISEGTELDPAIEQVRRLVDADPRVLAEPAPSVLLDRSAGANGIEIVVGFSTADDVVALVKSDLIKAVHATLDSHPLKQVASSA